MLGDAERMDLSEGLPEPRPEEIAPFPWSRFRI